MHANFKDYQNNYDKRKIEVTCRQAFDHSNVDIYTAFVEARRKTVAYAASRPPHYITRNSMALQMYDNMVGGLYDLYPHYMRVDKEKCSYLLLAPNIRLYPKKLDENYIPGNVVTDHVKEKRGQKLFYGEDKIIVLYAGPVLEDDDWFRDHKGYFATFVNEYYPKRPEFVIDLEEYIKTAVVATKEQAQEIQLVKPKTGTEGADTAEAK